MNNLKQWWAPVWTGLVIDPKGIHCRRMKNAIWLWLYCVLNANRSSGVLFRKIDTIATDMGVTRDTVIRWLALLRDGGYVETRNTGRYLILRVQMWKTLDGRAKVSLQVSGNRDTRDWESTTSHSDSDGAKTA